MKKRKPLLVVAALLLLSLFSLTTLPGMLQRRAYWAAYQPGGPDFPLLGFVADTTERAYSYLDMKQDGFGFSWSDVRAHYEQAVSSAAGQDEQLFLIDEMISLLDDGHTSLQHPVNELDRCLPIAVERLGDKVLVGAFADQLALAVPELEPDTELLTVDGTSATTLWQELREAGGFGLLGDGDLQLGKRFWQSYWFYRHRFTDNPGISRVEFRCPDGEIAQRDLVWQSATSVRAAYGVKVKAGTPKQGAVWQILDDGVGYMKVDTFSKAISNRQIDQAFVALQDCPSLIIDLRNNGGGSFSSYGTHVLSHLLTEQTVVSSKEFRNSPELHLFGGDGVDYPGAGNGQELKYYPQVDATVKPDGKAPFTGKPVVLLVNEACFSSADTFIASFADLGLGKIIGRTDPLHSGQPIQIAVPNTEYVLHLSSIINRSASGQVVEGRQLELAEYVPWTRDEILGQADPVLAAALRLLR